MKMLPRLSSLLITVGAIQATSQSVKMKDGPDILPRPTGHRHFSSCRFYLHSCRSNGSVLRRLFSYRSNPRFEA